MALASVSIAAAPSGIVCDRVYSTSGVKV